MDIAINRVQVKEDRRKVKAEVVEKLKESIKQVGLLNPITIDEGFVLIAGAHRLEAARLLGWENIPCTMISAEDLQAKLAELDENLVRNEGSVIEQGEWLAEKKRIYETLHPETKQGACGNKGGKIVESDKLSFSKDTAEKTGLSERTIQRSIQIAENLTPEAKALAKEVGITKTAALELARKPPEEQTKIVQPIRNFVRTVSENERRETAIRLLDKELNPVKSKERVQESEIDYDSATAIRNTYTSAIRKPSHLEMKPENVRCFYEQILKYGDLQTYINMMDRAIKNLQEVREFFLNPYEIGGILS